MIKQKRIKMKTYVHNITAETGVILTPAFEKLTKAIDTNEIMSLVTKAMQSADMPATGGPEYFIMVKVADSSHILEVKIPLNGLGEYEATKTAY